jgi:hypothetical protein
MMEEKKRKRIIDREANNNGEYRGREDRVSVEEPEFLERIPQGEAN